MSFFPPLPEPDPLPPRSYESGPGEAPPNWAPGAVPWSVLLARSADTAVALTHAVAYPQGMAFTVTTLLRPGGEGDREDAHWRPRTGSARGLRLGLEVADGRRAYCGGGLAPVPAPGPRAPDGFSLVSHEGGGSALVYRHLCWMWPLPPAAPLTFWCEWQARGIPETSVGVDATDAVGAARRAVELWPMPEPPEGRSGPGGMGSPDWYMSGGG